MIPRYTVTGPQDAPVLVLSNSLEQGTQAIVDSTDGYRSTHDVINVERPDDVTRLILDHLEG